MARLSVPVIPLAEALRGIFRSSSLMAYVVVPQNHKHPKKITVNLLQLLVGLDQAIDTADVARPPSHRAQEAGRLRGDLCVEHTVRHT